MPSPNALVAVSKILLQQNAPVLDSGFWLTPVDVYNDCKAVVVVVCLRPDQNETYTNISVISGSHVYVHRCKNS